MNLESFVRAHLPPPPAQLLEVGCGRGDLARAIAWSGGLEPARKDVERNRRPVR